MASGECIRQRKMCNTNRERSKAVGLTNLYHNNGTVSEKKK